MNVESSYFFVHFIEIGMNEIRPRFLVTLKKKKLRKLLSSTETRIKKNRDIFFLNFYEMHEVCKFNKN